MPPAELYVNAFECGRAVAGTLRAPVMACRTNRDLAFLAGRHLEQHRDNLLKQEDRLAGTKSWAEGFFDGFLDLAQEIRRPAIKGPAKRPG